MTPIRTLAPAAAAALLAVPALAACSGGSSGGTTSASLTPTTSPSPTASASAAVTGTPSVDTSRLTAIATCLKNAGLPTPTSTNVADAVAELLRLAQDPTTAAALRACGIPLPGGSTVAPPTTSSS